MSIRVHELAKEFKISTAALKKHLSDMGVVVKSHMSPVDEDVVIKIRAKFNEEVAAVKQRQMDRNLLHKKIILADRKKKEKSEEHDKKVKSAEESKETKKEVPVFVEKQIKKTPRRPVSRRDTEYKKPFGKHVSEKKQPPKNVPPETPDALVQKKLKEEKKVEEKKYVEKNKHLKAKVKHMKQSGRKKKFTPTEIEEASIAKSIKKTLSTTEKKKKYKKEDKENVVQEAKIVVSEFTSVSELAKMMNISATDIIGTFFKMGQMVTINQRLDKETLEMICAEFEFDVVFQDEYGTDILEEQKEEHADAELIGRSPIVTIMGHVDHGKTAILDYIRSANVIAGEAGGITQHIGAYQVDYGEKKITFIDTPGHEAFAAMRARGANVTDIAIIVVAANESVKKQTIEAIDHARAAGVQIIIAINKMDLKDANLDRTIGDLMKQNLMLEGYGGEILWIPCSAKTGEGINELLETINLASEMLELKAPVDVPGKGIVIEAKKDQRMGTIATVLLQEGTLSKGDSVVCGATFGKVRKLENERGKEINTLNPSDVTMVFGLNEVPKAGDILNQVESEKIARQISAERQHIRKEREMYQAKTNLDNLFQKIKENKMSEIKLIVKADTDGSVEALCDSFQKLTNEEVIINIIRRSVGGVNDADVNLASASDAIIIGFHVRVSNSAKKLAEEEKVDIKLYQIIYEAIEDLQKAMLGMLAPEFVEKVMGSAVVKQAFRIKKLGTIAGCYVEKGVITNSGLVRLYRNEILVHEGELSSLKHYSDEVKQVQSGSDCGIGIKDYNDIKEGDIIENYINEEVEKKL
jgi:translation initiation factor IF-2